MPITAAARKKEKNKEDDAFLKMIKVLMQIQKNIKADNYSDLRTYPLHADIKGDNLIWNRKNLVGIIDFDNVGRLNDTIIKDIANFIQFSCREKAGYKINLQKAKSFIDTYRKYREIKSSEIKFIPNLIISHYIDFFNYTYWLLQNNPQKIKKDNLYDCFKSAVWVSDNSDAIIAHLLYPAFSLQENCMKFAISLIIVSFRRPILSKSIMPTRFFLFQIRLSPLISACRGYVLRSL